MSSYLILSFEAQRDPLFLKVFSEDLNFRLSYKKLGLYLEIRLRFWDFKKFPRNQAFWEKCRKLVVFDFFEVCFFLNTFYHRVLLITKIKIRCQVQFFLFFFYLGFHGLVNNAGGGRHAIILKLFLAKSWFLW